MSFFINLVYKSMIYTLQMNPLWCDCWSDLSMDMKNCEYIPTPNCGYYNYDSLLSILL